MFRINEVLEYENERFRILSRFGNNFVWISIDNKSAFPSIIDLYSLDLAIQDESLHRVEDPYSYLIMLSPEDACQPARFRSARAWPGEPGWIDDILSVAHRNSAPTIDSSTAPINALSRRILASASISRSSLPLDRFRSSSERFTAKAMSPSEMDLESLKISLLKGESFNISSGSSCPTESKDRAMSSSVAVI